MEPFFKARKASTISAILLSQDKSRSGYRPGMVEPLPHIDYRFVQKLLTLRHGVGNEGALRPYGYLSRARDSYYQAHEDFQKAFRIYYDTHAYSIVLSREKAKLEKAGWEAKAKQLKYNEIATKKNRDSLESVRNDIDKARSKRNEATRTLSEMKTNFVNTQLPDLIAHAQLLFQQAMQEKARRELQNFINANWNSDPWNSGPLPLLTYYTPADDGSSSPLDPETFSMGLMTPDLTEDEL